MAAARWLVGVIASVILSFALATLVTRYYEGAVADRAQDIVGNAMPSVEKLSIARSDLRALENRLEDFASSRDASGETVHEIRALRQNFDESLAIYASLPFFPNERMIYMHVEEERAGLDAAIAALFADPTPANLARLHHAIDLVDSAIHRVVTFDAAQGERLGLEIVGIHAHANALSMALDAITVLLATIATMLALRQLRRAARARELEREAQNQREHALAEQNEALGTFAGRVAHDILSPLGTAQLAFDLVREQPATQRAVDRGIAAIRRVQVLVDGLLAFSRAGGHPDPGDATEVAPVIADVVAELRAQASQHHIDLVTSEVPAGAVACGSGVLTSILSNLIRNAIKYMSDSAERRIEVRVGLVADRWRFEVEDTGPGIPAEHRQRVFEPYVQLAPGSSGIGLGLATVDRLVRAHGGAVGLTPRQPHGSLFWFELPVALVAPAPAPEHVVFSEHRATDVS